MFKSYAFLLLLKTPATCYLGLGGWMNIGVIIQFTIWKSERNLVQKCHCAPSIRLSYVLH